MAFLKNALLVLAALVVSLIGIELIAYPLLLDGMSTNLMSFNGWYGRQLAQSSKAGVIPRDYIMITGDSYALGMGDGLNHAPPGSREPYASAHFIAQHLGRDVLSIARGGWSTVSASMAPGLFAEQTQWSLRYRVPSPAAILVYVYEGNDLTDNIRLASERFGADFASRPFSEEEIDGLIARQRRIDQRLDRRIGRIIEANLPATLFMANVVRRKVRLLIGPDERAERFQVSQTPAGATTRVLVGEQPRALPDRLQSPPLTLSETQWSNSLLIAERSLKAAGEAYPGVPLSIVYVPAPLSSYALASEAVSIFVGAADRTAPEIRPAAEIRLSSDRLRRAICGIARDLRYGYVDATPAIRRSARRTIVHGPGDWNHFNIEGYRTLGETVADALAADLRPNPPENCVPKSL